MRKVNLRAVQLELQLLRRQNHAHVPDPLLSEGLGLRRHSGGELVADKSGHLEVAVFVQRHLDPFSVGASQEDACLLDAGLGQIEPVLLLGLLKQGMPLAIGAEGLGAAQDAVRIFVRRDVTKPQGVGPEQSWQLQVLADGQDYVARALKLAREILVRFLQTAIGHPHRRMVGPEFAKNDIERNGFGALGRQFVRQPAINLPRPVQSKSIAEHPVRAHKGDAAFVDKNEAQVGRDRR